MHIDVVPPANRVDFTIYTLARGTSTSTGSSKTFTITARYGVERISATFTVSRLCSPPSG